MTELLTSAQMRAIEQAAIASDAVTGLELMERAGQGVVDAVFEEWPALAKTSHRAVVLCGPGNNGGDGFVVARLLKQHGWDVDVFLYGDPDRLPVDARTNYDRWCALGPVQNLTLKTLHDLQNEHFSVVCDALFGTGLTRPVQGDLVPILKTIRLGLWPYERARLPLEHYVAIDVPTSICADSGELIVKEGDTLAHFRADLTVTFHAPKLGHYLCDGPDVVGKLAVKDIGLTYSCDHSVRLTGAGDDLDKEASRHKFSHGHAIVLSGAAGHTGAARLSARGALRVGAGMVTVASPKSAMLENALQLTAIMVLEADGPQALKRVLDDERINALCLGPALGVDTRAAKLVAVALEAKRKTVCDADALTLLSQDAGLFAKLHESCVLTPHAGEFKRLFPDIAEKLDAPAITGPAYSKVDATRDAAKRAGCVVLFKGADTVIASPDGKASINASLYERSAPWLATAGSGDVLAGFITGLLARGYAPHAAAEVGAYLHTECGLSFGAGLVAEDLPEELPKVFKMLGI